MDDDLLSIGRFARLTGLSVGALRHYDELDLLRPAEVDRFTGYRRYRRDHLDAARAIARLRELELPLDEIREVLAIDDPAERARRLAAHRARIEARTYRLQRVLHHVTQLSKGERSCPGRPSPPTSTRQPAARSRSACSTTRGRCWRSRTVHPSRTTRWSTPRTRALPLGRGRRGGEPRAR